MLKRFLALFLLLAILLGLVALVIPAQAAHVDLKSATLAALYEADISQIREAIQEELVTVTELTQYYLGRIEKYNGLFNCFITLCDDALAVAAQRDAQLAQGNAEGLLFGVPVVIKDNMDLAGYHTTNGYKKADSQIADSNAAVVDYLLSEGAVIIGKTNMSTAAQDALRSVSRAVGETRNAYDTGLSAGGSSGGSAVATSLNFAAASLGSDTNSSLRIPAALAGCVSMRSTFGLISVDGIKRLNSTRDVAGAITRSVYDQAIMLDVLTQGAFCYTENLNKEALKGMRIGILEQLSYATGATGLRTDANIDDEVAAAFARAVDELRACGAEVVTISVPKLFTLSNATFSKKDQASKDALYDAFQKTLADADLSAVVYPTYLTAPIRSGTDAQGINWNKEYQVNINNCRTLSPSAGLPEITVPIGNHSRGAGIGMEIASLKGSEQLLLNIAYSYTSAYDHRAVPSGAPNDYAGSYICSLQELVACSKVTQNAQQLLHQLQIDLQRENATAPPDYSESQKTNPASLTLWVGIGVTSGLFLAVILLIYKYRKKKKASRGRYEKAHHR